MQKTAQSPAHNNTGTTLTAGLDNAPQSVPPHGVAANAMIVENPSELSSIGTFHFNSTKVNLKNFEKQKFDHGSDQKKTIKIKAHPKMHNPLLVVNSYTKRAREGGAAD